MPKPTILGANPLRCVGAPLTFGRRQAQAPAMPSTDTIRDLILDGYEISIHCRAYPCSNRG